MTIAEYRRLQREEEEKKKLLPMQKISNNFLDNTIFKNNTGALKTLFYLSTVLRKLDLDTKKEDELIDITIDLDEFVNYSMLDERVLKRSVKTMQETSISFITSEELNGKKTIKEELHINLLPMFKIIYGKKIIEAKIFVKIAKLIIDVEANYTYLNTKQFMKLDSKHSIRMLGLINKIDCYDTSVTDETILREIKYNKQLAEEYPEWAEAENVTQEMRRKLRKPISKTKIMTLDELNEFFGTSYTRWAEIERKILKPAQEELDSKSPLTFFYDVNYKPMSKGRPAFDNVKIYVKLQQGVQTRLSNFM